MVSCLRIGVVKRYILSCKNFDENCTKFDTPRLNNRVYIKIFRQFYMFWQNCNILRCLGIKVVKKFYS